MNSDQYESRIIEAEFRAKNAEIRAAEAEQMLKMIYQSHSWRLTGPLRWITAQVRLFRSHGLLNRLAAFIKSIGRFVFRKIHSFTIKRPGLRNRCVRVLQRTGLYENYLKYRYAGFLGSSAIYPDNKMSVPVAFGYLSPYARLVYTDLKDAVENSRESR